jgi:AbiV family abortive infection protein
MPEAKAKIAGALAACVDHARNLVTSAKAVATAGHPHIAYHLATLALEELGRRQLLVLEATVVDKEDPPSWLGKARIDHVKKLFWCLYGLSDLGQIVDQAWFFELMKSAGEMHDRRLAGLYVDDSGDRLNIPASAVSGVQGQRQIALAEAMLGVAEQKLSDVEISEERKELQLWFLSVFDDPELRKRAMQPYVFEKLKELQDVVVWTKWLKAEFERHDAEMAALLEKELQRDVNAMGVKRKEKWRAQFRLETHSHSIRRSALAKWNVTTPNLKIKSVNGRRSKQEIIVEATFMDNIDVGGLWYQTLGTANHLLTALNMATSGLWWWVLPRHKTRFYDSIVDLDSHAGIDVSVKSLEVFRPPLRPLTDINIETLKQCFLALPGPMEVERSQAYGAYLGGIHFANLSDIHWRCDGMALQQFLLSLKLLLIEAKTPHVSEPMRQQVDGLLNEKYPELEAGSKECLLRHIADFDAQRPFTATVEVGDVFIVKLLCEETFRNLIVPRVLKERVARWRSDGEGL